MCSVFWLFPVFLSHDMMNVMVSPYFHPLLTQVCLVGEEKQMVMLHLYSLHKSQVSGLVSALYSSSKV